MKSSIVAGVTEVVCFFHSIHYRHFEHDLLLLLLFSSNIYSMHGQCVKSQ